MAMEPKPFAKIDTALSRYYASLNQVYFNEDGKGKFLFSCEEEGYEEDEIDDELGGDAEPENCSYCDFDADFPFDHEVVDQIKQTKIHYILKHCYQNGKAPSLESILQLSVNMNVFKTNAEQCDNYKPVIANCSHLRRLAMALEYYSLLTIETNKLHEKIFNVFVTETYALFLDDCVHLMCNHCHDLDEINDELIAKYQFARCKVADCEFTNRHRSWRTHKNIGHQSNGNDPNLNFYIELFDSLHYYLIHLYDIGMRVKADAINDNAKKLCTMQQIISAKKEKFKDETEFNSDKFNVAQIMPVGENADEKLFVDKLFEYVQTNDISTKARHDLQSFLENEEYDSECIEYDLYDKPALYGYVCPSNIANQIKNNHCSAVIRQFIKERHKTKTLCLASFNVGLIFYYWPWYKHSAGKQYEEEIDYDNINDYGGYHIYELYLEKGKYQNIKEEVLNCPHGQHTNIPITKNEFQQVIALKADKYLTTNKSKKMKALDGNKWYLQHLHYDVVKNKAIQKHNLIALLLYCNFSALSTDFSSTFRATYPFEPLTLIKKRNANYWHLSKTLRETVQFYGSTASGIGGNCMKGPFYCGMSFVMNVPQFNIRLCGPTSTSIQQEATMNFATSHGIIMRLNNVSGDYYGAYYLRSFYCAWISDHREEEEVLFFGGDFRIRIESVTVVKTLKSYVEHFNSLFYFDAMLNGSNMFKMECSKSIKVGYDERIIKALTANELEMKQVETDDFEFDAYIIDTFKVFCVKKTKLVINMDYLKRYFQELNHLVVSTITRDDIRFIDSEELKQNVLRENIIKLFKNVSEIVIYSTDRTGKCSYPFSLSLMLQCMDLSEKLKRIVIKGSHKYSENMTDRKSYWLRRSWIARYAKIEKLKFENWKLLLEITKNSHGNNEDSLTCLRNYHY